MRILIKSNVDNLLTWKALANERTFSCNFTKRIKGPLFYGR